MAQRKIWTHQEDQLIRKLVKDNQNKSQEDKMKWGQIAEYLEKNLEDSHRTGKQCRERWHNQLDPSIKGTEFTNKQIDQLFELQRQMGNKWASIARDMPGRTDNNIKNFFYSSLRRALRQINCYVSKYKRKSNIKPFKQTILTKVLNINDEKYKDKLDIKGKQALEIAEQVKALLARLSKEQEEIDFNQEQLELRQNLVKGIQNFNKVCKKRKQKKQVQVQQYDMFEQEMYNIASESVRQEQISQNIVKKYTSKSRRSNKNILVQQNKMQEEIVKQQRCQPVQQNKLKPVVNFYQTGSKLNELVPEVATHEPFQKQQNCEKFFEGMLDEKQIYFPLDMPDLMKKRSSVLSRRQSSKSQMGVSRQFKFDFIKGNNENLFLGGSRRKIDSSSMIRKQSLGQNNLFNSLNLESPIMFASINLSDQLGLFDRDEINQSMIFK